MESQRNFEKFLVQGASGLQSRLPVFLRPAVCAALLAAPGETVTLFGTGFGPTEPTLEAGRIPGVQAPLVGEVSFYFGSLEPPLIETVAGDGTQGYGGAAVAAQLSFPGGVALDGAGNLYIADTNNHRIRRVVGAVQEEQRCCSSLRGCGPLLRRPLSIHGALAGRPARRQRGRHRRRAGRPNPDRAVPGDSQATVRRQPHHAAA